MFSGLEANVEIRIPFHDVDPAGVVWHGNYFRYFEAARDALLDDLNYGYGEMAESGFIWPVVDLSARFTRPISFGQRVRVRARLMEWEFRLKIEYALFDPDGQRLGKGLTVQVPVDMASWEMAIGSPDILLKRVARRLEALEGGRDSDG